jgi:hypothetical protein
MLQLIAIMLVKVKNAGGDGQGNLPPKNVWPCPSIFPSDNRSQTKRRRKSSYKQGELFRQKNQKYTDMQITLGRLY